MKRFFKGIFRWAIIITLIIVLLRIFNSLSFSGTSGFLTLIAFLLAPVCLLIGGIYLLRSVLRKKDKPAEPEKNPGKEKPKTPEKKPWFVRTVVTLAIIALVIYGGIRFFSPNDAIRNQLVNQPQSTTDTLGCDNGSFIEPNLSGVTRYVVMPRECWTNVIYRPSRGGQLSPKFLTGPKGTIMIQWGYGGDEWEPAYLTDPGSNKRFQKPLTTVRFMNTGTQPIIIDITVS